MGSTIGIIAGVLTSVSLLPQLFKLLRKKQSSDASKSMFVILLVGLVMWVVYGIQQQDWPIILTNGFSFLVNTAILICDGYYMRHPGGKFRLEESKSSAVR